MATKPPIGIPYAEAGVLSADLEGLLSQMIDAWNTDPVEDADEFVGGWARSIMTELDIADTYYLTCPECDKRLPSGGGTEDEVTKGAGDRYARHYAWQHTKARLGTVPSDLARSRLTWAGKDQLGKDHDDA
jgi:hypothetical protein